MKKKVMKEYLTNLIKNIIEPAAIIDENRNVLYVNSFFEEAFMIRNSANKIEDGSSKIKSLSNLKLASKYLGIPQEIIIPRKQEKAIINVYLLNNLQVNNSLYLLLVKKDENSIQEISNPYQDEEKFRIEKLSEEFSELVGESIEFKKALVSAQRAASSNISVLITGESGTGKEILARAIHKASPRFSKPLIDVNCAAIPDTLIESELFGYEKGAFTGAKAEGSKGYFDEAHGGTILLDEIGDASLQTQSKLLRVLESGTFKRVGGTRNVKVDVRIISSTNRHLNALIEENKFREDLFFRLNAFTIYLPPLRQRREDIPLLVDYFLKSNEDIEKRGIRFSSPAMEILGAYHWPGNVRELKGVISYAVNMSKEELIGPSSLPNFLFAPNLHRSSPADSSPFSQGKNYNIGKATENLEENLIREVLGVTKNKTAAMKKLGISRRTFYQKIKKYNLE
ncbi:MAG TPA: AAA family ATPase [Deltaproteobacteria bacterium]|nr:AAA family ATPase [Deltaproteobacteria bacterium]